MAGHVSRQICIGVKNLFNQKFGSFEESTKKKKAQSLQPAEYWHLFSEISNTYRTSVLDPDSVKRLNLIRISFDSNCVTPFILYDTRYAMASNQRQRRGTQGFGQGMQGGEGDGDNSNPTQNIGRTLGDVTGQLGGTLSGATQGLGDTLGGVGQQAGQLGQQAGQQVGQLGEQLGGTLADITGSSGRTLGDIVKMLGE